MLVLMSMAFVACCAAMQTVQFWKGLVSDIPLFKPFGVQCQFVVKSSVVFQTLFLVYVTCIVNFFFPSDGTFTSMSGVKTSKTFVLSVTNYPFAPWFTVVHSRPSGWELVNQRLLKLKNIQNCWKLQWICYCQLIYLQIENSDHEQDWSSVHSTGRCQSCKVVKYSTMLREDKLMIGYALIALMALKSGNIHFVLQV